MLSQNKPHEITSQSKVHVHVECMPGSTILYLVVCARVLYNQYKNNNNKKTVCGMRLGLEDKMVVCKE